MSYRPLDIEWLVARLTGETGGWLDAAELDATLNWLAGSERAEAGELIRHLGSSRERPDLTRRVLHRIDAQIFLHGRLALERAFVHAAIAEPERRARFRRLMTAFHPDHHPGDDGWLTPRSQAIHDAWRRFRRGEEPTESGEATPGSGPAPARQMQTVPSERRSARIVPEHTPLLLRLRLRLQNVRHLQGKAMLMIAVIAFVPVAWMYFAYQPYREGLPAAPLTSTDDETRLSSELAPHTDPPILADFPPHGDRLDQRLAEAPEPPSPVTPPPSRDELLPGDGSPVPTEASEKPDEKPADQPSSLDSSVAESADSSDQDEASPETRRPEAAEQLVVITHDLELPEAIAEQPVDLEVELRIAELLGSYRDTFERGQLDGLLGHFSDHPRENRNEGRRWFRDNYRALFDNSSRRRLYIDIQSVTHHDKGWQVDGRFVLQIDYPQRQSVRVDRPVRYLILEEQEQFRIASIEY